MQDLLTAIHQEEDLHETEMIGARDPATAIKEMKQGMKVRLERLQRPRCPRPSLQKTVEREHLTSEKLLRVATIDHQILESLLMDVIHPPHHFLVALQVQQLN
jgi:hypothetical protein